MVLPDLPVIPGVVIDHVPGATGYAAATDGTIWSCLGLGPRFKNLQPWRMLAAKKINGYLAVSVRYEHGRYLKKVHTLVLETFVGPCPKGMQCRHFPDKDTANCALGNIRWDTPTRNNADKKFHGTHQAGERNPNHKLTATQVEDIRRVYAKANHAQLARDYGVSTMMIYFIGTGKNWRAS